MSNPTLQIDGLHCGYGQAMVIRGLDLSIAPGEALAVLGKNGMGKTTLLKAIMGFLPHAQGHVRFCGSMLGSGQPHRLAAQGIAYAPQEKAVFQDLSIEENLRLAVPDGPTYRSGLERVASYFPFLPQRLRQKAGTLSGGEQKMLILARALMSRPRLLLIDEITEGLQPSVIERIARVLQAERREREIAMLMIEQNVGFALACNDRFAVMELGELREHGRADDPDAQERILGELGV